MALQESFTRTDGNKIVLRQSADGVWSVKCLTPPDLTLGKKQWDMAWEYVGVPEALDETKITPLTEAEARAIYEGYMG